MCQPRASRCWRSTTALPRSTRTRPRSRTASPRSTGSSGTPRASVSTLAASPSWAIAPVAAWLGRGAPRLATVATLARQVLVYPMLDDRNVIPDPSLVPFTAWTYDSNLTGWTALLGDATGGPDVPASAAPAGRSTSPAWLPPTSRSAARHLRDSDRLCPQDGGRRGLGGAPRPPRRTSRLRADGTGVRCRHPGRWPTACESWRPLERRSPAPASLLGPVVPTSRDHQRKPLGRGRNDPVASGSRPGRAPYGLPTRPPRGVTMQIDGASPQRRDRFVDNSPA